MLEVDAVELAVSAERAWTAVRNLDLARSPIVRALFGLRTVPDRLRGKTVELRFRLEDLKSTPETPGFQLLIDEPPRELAVGAIGKVWHLSIPFLHVPDAESYRDFHEPDYVKVAWALRVEPLEGSRSRVVFELRVEATDPEAWQKFRRYFRVIGPGSHFIRRLLLSQLQRDLHAAEADENRRPLPGDDLLPDALGQFTHSIAIAATPEKIWPWLVQMGCGRAGFYSIDLLDNSSRPSAREIHPELQQLAVGDRVPAAEGEDDFFEVLRLEENRLLALGGLFDVEAKKQIGFRAARPAKFWQVTWTFVLEPLDETQTRLYARARGAFPPSERLHALWIRPVHHLMQTTQLRNLGARAEGRLSRDSFQDVFSSVGGAAIAAFGLLTPFLREQRSHWGVDREVAEREYPGDRLVPDPRWSWTHGVEIDAPPDAVWPWIVQLGADRGGFYSYQWLENLAGCDLRNAESVHPEWALRPGDDLVLHPQFSPLKVVDVVPRKYLLAGGAPDSNARADAQPWVAVSWLFFLEPIGNDRTRLISRYRCASSEDFKTLMSFGPTVLEPVGFAMDRRMLLEVKARAERLATV
jgi:hypothetical protein